MTRVATPILISRRAFVNSAERGEASRNSTRHLQTILVLWKEKENDASTLLLSFTMFEHFEENAKPPASILNGSTLHVHKVYKVFLGLMFYTFKLQFFHN